LKLFFNWLKYWFYFICKIISAFDKWTEILTLLDKWTGCHWNIIQELYTLDKWTSCTWIKIQDCKKSLMDEQILCCMTCLICTIICYNYIQRYIQYVRWWRGTMSMDFWFLLSILSSPVICHDFLCSNSSILPNCSEISREEFS
jgi:hypothetical protein